MSDGYFPHGTSMLRRVHEERAVGLLYGLRALMVGAMQPLAFIGTVEQSAARQQPWRRLTHTAEIFEAVFFGSREEADKALALTHRMHQHVRGEIPEDAGPFPAGTRYSAYDPALMLWVVAPMYDSARVLYDLLVRPLSEDEAEALWQDYLRFGELFGMPREAAPATTGELDAWWAEQWAGDGTFLTDYARKVGTSIGTNVPSPGLHRLPMAAVAHVLIGSLPEPVREEYGFGWSQRDEVAYRAIGAASRASRPLVPKRLRRGSCQAFHDSVAAHERRRLRSGRPPFDITEEAAAR